MALHLRPVGPLPATTYWARRAGVLVVLLLLLLALRACTGGDDPEQLEQGAGASASALPSAIPDPSLSPSASPLASASPAVVSCPDTAITVTAATAQEAYPVGGSPVLRLTVTNTGTVPCTRPLGQGAVELTVFSGSDRIWSSDDCTPGGPPGPVQLAPGQARTQTLTWSGKRSRPGCTGESARAAAGTYRVIGRAGSVRSAAGAFRITG